MEIVNRTGNQGHDYELLYTEVAARPWDAMMYRIIMVCRKPSGKGAKED